MIDTRPIRPCECGYYDIDRHHSRAGGGWCEFYRARTEGWASDACGPAALWYSPEGRKIAASKVRAVLNEQEEG